MNIGTSLKVPRTAAEVAAHNARVAAGKKGINFNPIAPLPVEIVAKRIRQDSKPLMNKWEQEFFDMVADEKMFDQRAVCRVRAQAKRYKLANGVWYRPDITCTALDIAGRRHEMAFEIKGGEKMKGVAKGKMTIKIAAHEWPEVIWFFCYKIDGQWKWERVLP